MLRQATTEGIGHRMQFLVCQGGELFFYDGFEGGHGPCPHLLLPHLHTAAVGRAGQQRPVEVSVTHSLSLSFPANIRTKWETATSGSGYLLCLWPDLSRTTLSGIGTLTYTGAYERI